METLNLAALTLPHFNVSLVTQLSNGTMMLSQDEVYHHLKSCIVSNDEHCIRIFEGEYSWILARLASWEILLPFFSEKEKHQYSAAVEQTVAIDEMISILVEEQEDQIAASASLFDIPLTVALKLQSTGKM